MTAVLLLRHWGSLPTFRATPQVEHVGQAAVGRRVDLLEERGVAQQPGVAEDVLVALLRDGLLEALIAGEGGHGDAHLAPRHVEGRQRLGEVRTRRCVGGSLRLGLLSLLLLLCALLRRL
eukprot:10307780-Alexandrium_andersonii.AAC.2